MGRQLLIPRLHFVAVCLYMVLLPGLLERCSLCEDPHEGNLPEFTGQVTKAGLGPMEKFGQCLASRITASSPQVWERT